MASNPATSRYEATNTFDAAYLLSPVAILPNAEPQMVFGFPVENRRGPDGFTLDRSPQALSTLFWESSLPLLQRFNDFHLLLYLATHPETGFTFEEVEDMIMYVKGLDAPGAESFRPKLERVFGVGITCTVCAAKGIHGNIYGDKEEFTRHVSVSHGTDPRSVVCPLCASRASCTTQRERLRVYSRLAQHLQDVHGSERSRRSSASSGHSRSLPPASPARSRADSAEAEFLPDELRGPSVVPPAVLMPPSSGVLAASSPSHASPSSKVQSVVAMMGYETPRLFVVVRVVLCRACSHLPMVRLWLCSSGKVSVRSAQAALDRAAQNPSRALELLLDGLRCPHHVLEGGSCLEVFLNTRSYALERHVRRDHM